MGAKKKKKKVSYKCLVCGFNKSRFIKQLPFCSSAKPWENDFIEVKGRYY